MGEPKLKPTPPPPPPPPPPFIPESKGDVARSPLSLMAAPPDRALAYLEAPYKPVDQGEAGRRSAFTLLVSPFPPTPPAAAAAADAAAVAA